MDRSLQPGVMLVGEALVDEFTEQPVAGGAPLNVARSLAALGLPALLVSRLGLQQRQGQGAGASGADAGARLVLASMRRFGLDEQGLQFDARHATGRVSVVEEGGAHAFVIHPDAAWDHLDEAPAQALMESEAPAVLYFGSLAQRILPSRTAIQSLLRSAQAGGCLRYLDLNLREGCMQAEVMESLVADSLAQADWLKLNDAELLQLQRWFGAGPLDPLQPAAQLQRPVATLLRRFGVQRLVLTRGAAGYACFDADGEVLAEGPGRQDLTLIDTVGAGDAFSAMVLAAHLRSVPLARAMELANGYAAAICGQRGPLPQADSFFQPWRQALGHAGLLVA
ncbi:PfkB family carbohydrate kinase [Roseateles sp. DB2]|uniref:PfkB family carbohydrate kinase n=1 Tax=Roseateles sp. DB2 TaxID=3453717 RepID=UPI003EE95037